MKVEYFQRKIGIVQREIWSYLRTVSSRVIEKFFSVKRLDGFVLCIQGQRKTSSSKLQAAWKRLRIVNKDRTFSYKYILDFVRLRFRLSRVSPRRTAFTPTSRCKCSEGSIQGCAGPMLYQWRSLRCRERLISNPFH